MPPATHALAFGSQVAAGEVLLVHCAAGISRSAGVALGLLAAQSGDAAMALAALDDAVERTHELGWRLRARDHHPNACSARRHAGRYPVPCR